VSQIRQSGRIIRRGSDEYRYDSAGRLTEKRTEKPGFRPEIWRYRWDAHGQMRSLIAPDGERWRYAYDAFGRRISKRREGDTRDKPAGYHFLWSGDQLIEETPVYANGTPVYEDSIHWLYEPGALTPVARSEKGRLHYLVSDHMGTPRELLTEQGDVAWSNRLSTWGKSTRYHLAANDDITCNLRFAGQYADEESGLHYNRHRYYDSDTGQYLSPDPIGLLGGVNPYGYVHNPMGWVDPLGLEKLETGHVYRMGSGTDSNMTPRPGKDTTTGLSTTIEKPSGKYQTLDVAALNNSGFDVIQDGKNHASVRLSNDPDMTKLREWADSRGSDIQSPYTKAIKDCCG
jgi:RHS repeat-associated protein